MRSACDMAALVEARHNGRLDRREAGAIDRHLGSCASCHTLAGDLALIADLGRRLRHGPPIDDLDHRRARVRLLREAARPRPPAPRLLVPALGVLVVAAIAALVMWPRDERSKLESIALRVPATAPADLAPIVADVTPAEGTRYERVLEPMAERVRLFEGWIDVRVRPLAASQRFLVVTTDGEVEVRGTAFRVHAENGLLRDVVVREGKVEVRSAGGSTLLLAGERWRALPSVGGSETATPAAAPSASATGSTPSEAAAALTPPPVETTAPETSGPQTAAAASTTAPRERDPAAGAFAAAVKQLEDGDYESAAKALGDYARAHAADARSEDADFLVIVALQRAGRHAAAAQAARRYLERHPHGDRRAEAQVIAARGDTKRP
jgi:outer membrane lipoprotein YfiO/FecR-like protein